MADSINFITIRNLSKSFESMVVLDKLNIDVHAGENLVVFGRSGTGKSVLLKCIIGLLAPEEGEIVVDGKKVLELNKNDLNDLRKNIGFLFQSAALYDSMNVRENLEFPLRRHFAMTQKEIDKKVYDTLDLVSLTEAINKMPSELSGGMRKRIGLARSIITDPKLMLYDEPTTGLDPITTKEISNLILKLQKHLNMTSIAVTHDLICAKIIADRAIFLKDGHILFEGNIDELQNSKDPFLQNFISEDYKEEI